MSCFVIEARRCWPVGMVFGGKAEAGVRLLRGVTRIDGVWSLLEAIAKA